VGGVGAFPKLENPAVIWCGVQDDDGRLARLQAAVETACEGLGHAREKRPFRPHLTLGRVKGRRNLQPLIECLKIAARDLESSFTASRFHLFRSITRPTGAVYTVLETVELRGSDPGTR
jgi:2'-5' RNA ligase